MNLFCRSRSGWGLELASRGQGHSAAARRRGRAPSVEPLELRELLASTIITPIPITAGAYPLGDDPGARQQPLVHGIPRQQDRVDQSDDAGVTESAALPTANSYPNEITQGPDGNLWFTEYGNNKIGSINPKTLAITESAAPDRQLLAERHHGGARRQPLVHRVRE